MGEGLEKGLMGYWGGGSRGNSETENMMEDERASVVGACKVGRKMN